MIFLNSMKSRPEINGNNLSLNILSLIVKLILSFTSL